MVGKTSILGVGFSSLALVAALAGSVSLDASPAFAGNNLGGFMGGFVGGLVGGMIGASRPHYYYGGYGGQRRRNVGGSSGGANSQPSQGDSSDALASLAPPTTTEQTAVLKGIVPVNALGSVGATDDLERISKIDQEQNRDYMAKIEELLDRINRPQDDSKTANGKEPSKDAPKSDITQHAILESLDNAIRATDLLKFETFRDESWSPERLRVMIIERVSVELGDALDSTKHQALTEHDLDAAIAKAARSVQTRLFETSELLAANRDSTLFLLRLYQTHGDVSSDVRERTEQMLAKAASDGVGPLEPLLQRDPNGYALRYRGERIIYDCLTDNVEAITASDTGVAAEPEIEKRLLDTNREQCVKWVSDQLVGADGRLKPQEPVPLRVVWSADGPRTDPSMFSRAPDDL
jgi:hypothetical protein